MFAIAHPKKHIPQLLATSFLALVVILAATADWIAPQNPILGNLSLSLLPPFSKGHILGTDELGRDILSRLLYGTRISMLVGIGSVVVAGIIGTILGLISAYYPGWLGEFIMRLADIALSLPAVLLGLVIACTVGPSLINVIFIIGLIYWAHFARMVRGEALSINQMAFVALAHVAGCHPLRIIYRHIYPNVVNTIIVIFSLQFAAAILLEATLSFLGLGVPPPMPSLGLMVSEGKEYIGSAWWIITFPGLTIMLIALSINLVGDWLRDALDPKFRQL